MPGCMDNVERNLVKIAAGSAPFLVASMAIESAESTMNYPCQKEADEACMSSVRCLCLGTML